MQARRPSWRGTILLILTVMLVSAFGARPVHAGFGDNPDRDGGWVRAGVVGGGCNEDGVCDSVVTPGTPTLFEYTPHRERVARNEGPAPTHGGDPTFVPRQMCRFQGQEQGWSAGVWHHGAYWTLTIVNGARRWSGPSSPHWAFEHQDTCRPQATPSPSPTPPAPTPTPPGGGAPGGGAPPPGAGGGGQIRIAVNVRVIGTPPTPGTPTTTGSGAYRPGAPVRAAVHYPSSWNQHASWGGVSYSGCGQQGSDWQASFAAPTGECTLTFELRFGAGALPEPPGANPTPPPRCFADQGYPSPMPVEFSAPGVQAVMYPAPVESFTPDLPANYQAGRVQGRTLDIIFRPDRTITTGGMRESIYVPWRGGGEMFIELVDRGRDAASSADDRLMLALDATRQGQPHESSQPFSGAYGTFAVRYETASGVTPLGPMTWHVYTTDRGGGWYEHIYWMNNPAETGRPDDRWPAITPLIAAERGWIREPGAMGFRLALQPGHLYDLRVRTAMNSCGEFYSAVTRAQFRAGEARTISGQLWDVTNPHAPVAAGAVRHQVALDAIIGSVTRPLDQQASQLGDAAFRLTVTREDLEAALQAAGQPINDAAPIRFRLRVIPSSDTFRNGQAIYYPTTRAARPPRNLNPTVATPTQVEWTASIQHMMRQDWPEAAFYLATFPFLPRGPSETIYAHFRRAESGAPFMTTRGTASPSVFSWPYGAMLELYPDVDLSIPPDAGAWAGYEIAGQVEQWRYLGSPPWGVADDSYGPSVPIRIIWSKYPPTDRQRPGSYLYRLPRIDGHRPPIVDVRLAYQYRIRTPFGVESMTFSDEARGFLTVQQIAPQVGP